MCNTKLSLYELYIKKEENEVIPYQEIKRNVNVYV